ncbi:MAG TPA: prepilin-type N-terminal cleavage/methylation domain-containing protein [Kofleriaceae bacterium]
MRKRQRGFTLLELMITLAVTTIGLVGLLSLHLSIARGNDNASRASEAQQLANQTLETLRAQRNADMMMTLTGSSTSLPPLDVTLSSVVGRANMTYRRRVVITTLNAASSSLWLMRVEVSYTEDGGSAGAAGGSLDHTMAAELIRTVEEAL